MADDQAPNIPGFDDFSAATDRLRRAQDAGQPLDPNDVDIFRRGNATHGQAYDAAGAAATPNITDLPVISQPGPGQGWRSDPTSWQSYATRAATNVIAGIPDLLTMGADAAMHAYDAARGSPNVPRPGYEYPSEYPSQALRRVAGVPELPENASTGQKALDIATTLASAAGPGAVARGLEAAPGIVNAAKAVGGSLFKNAVVAPGASALAAEGANEVGGDYAQPLSFAASLAAPAAVTGATAVKEAVENYLGQRYARRYQAPPTPPGERVQKPGALAVGKAASDLGLDPNKFPTFGMLADPEGQQMEGSLAATSLGRAVKQSLFIQRPMFEDQANQLLLNRRAIPAETPGNAEVVQAANAARVAAVTQGVPEVEASAIPAVENFWNQKLGHNPEIEVTNTANALRQMYIAAGDPGAKAAIRSRYNQLANPATATGNILDPLDVGGIATRITPDGRMFAPWQAVRGWRTGLGTATAKADGLKGADLRQAYGAITNDMRNGASYWVHPEAFDAANQIESNEYAAKDLQSFLDKTLLNKSAAYASNFGNAIDTLKEDPHEFARLMGGPYDPSGPPLPQPGSGDIRKQAYDLGTVGKASYVPGQQYERPLPLIRSLWELAKGGGFGGLGTLLTHAAGGSWPVALGVGVPASAIWPYAKSNIIESPRTRNPMMGLPQPPISSPSLGDVFSAAQAAVQQQKLRDLMGGEQSSEPQWTPPSRNWTPYSPRTSPLSALPTTSPILAAFNGANVGNPRSLTG